jgi:hypothetical protein
MTPLPNLINARSFIKSDSLPAGKLQTRRPPTRTGENQRWLGTTLTDTCGTEEASQQRYRDTMTAAGFDVTEASFECTDDLDLEHLVGSLCSALPVQRLPPPDQRGAFTGRVRRAVSPHKRFTEPVGMRMLLGQRLPTGGQT